MTRAATIVLAVLISLATLFVTGDACNNVPSVSWGDACLKACSAQPWYRLCLETLRNGLDTAEVTFYALIVARLAKQKYEDTMATIDQVLGSGSLPGDVREKVGLCKDGYARARGLMVGVAEHLSGCDFTRARQEYLDAVAGIKSCQSVLQPFKGSLLAMVTADHDLTMVAYGLGALIVGR